MPNDAQGGSELYYRDKSGKKRDAGFHEEILNEGDDAPGKAISDKIRDNILAKARGYKPEGTQYEALGQAPPLPKKAKDAWNPNQPREPAGSSEGGQFASITGGGISGGATGGPAFAKKELGEHKDFQASTSAAQHHHAVQQVIKSDALRNHTYRWKINKYIDEAKTFDATENIPALKAKIGESLWREAAHKQGTGKIDAAAAGKMFAKAKAFGFHTPPPAVNVPGPKPKVAAEATIPVATPEWTKVGGQEGSVAGGTYKDPQGNSWYVKTPKTEAHVNADLLSNQLYKLAGVAVSDEVKTVLGGKPAVASKIIPFTNTLAGTSGADKTLAHEVLREGFAVDAWLGNRDVIGQTFDNVLVTNAGTVVHRIDQGGTLMYRAQGETKEFGPVPDEITSMRSSQINPQTASVFGSMTDQEVSDSIDKVTAIPVGSIFKLVKDHGFPPELAHTLIARRAWLADYQKTLNVPGASPTPSMVETQKATAAQAAWAAAGVAGVASPAELEKAKKVGPYYPAPASEMGKAAVKAFNEKWATKTPEAHELEQKVAEYKATKAMLEHVQQQEMSAAEKSAAQTKAEQAAATKAVKAAAKAKEEAESAKHQAEIAKIAADIGIDPEHAEQVDTLVELAGGDKTKLIQQFKKFYESGQGKHGLPTSPFESAMIQMYVGPHAYDNNAKLRGGVWDDKTHVFTNAIQTALNKLPPYNAPIKRGFTTSTADQESYKPGTIHMWHGFSSCGKQSSFGGNMQCVIHPLPGDKTRARDLGLFNPNETGGEVLIKAHTSVKVVSVTGSPGGTMHVVLQEVEALL